MEANETYFDRKSWAYFLDFRIHFIKFLVALLEVNSIVLFQQFSIMNGTLHIPSSWERHIRLEGEDTGRSGRQCPFFSLVIRFHPQKLRDGQMLSQSARKNN